MKNKTNCPNCGAPIKGIKCDYCGTYFHDWSDIDTKDMNYIRINHNGSTVLVKAYLNSVTMEHIGWGKPEVTIEIKGYMEEQEYDS